MKVPAAVLDALKAATTDGNLLHLTGPRMTKALYQRVNEVIEGAGGRWDKSVQAHVFPGGAVEAIAPVLATGMVVTLREKRQDSQYFPTPAPVVARLLELAELAPGMEVLEPSAGTGAIATALSAAGAVVDCIERDPGYAAVLTEAGVARAVRAADFLAVLPEPRYDRVVMNPPFTRGTDMAHVEHALRFLKPDGLLVSVMFWTVTDQSPKTATFRALVENRGGTVEAVASRAFAESGTTADTVIVTIPATARTGAPPVAWPQRETPKPAVSETELGSPLEILRELKDNLRQALSAFDAVEKLLTEPITPSRPAETVELPVSRPQEQLSFDLDGAA